MTGLLIHLCDAAMLAGYAGIVASPVILLRALSRPR